MAATSDYARLPPEDYDRATDQVRVGQATPGSPVGDIWVARGLIAQLGLQEVRELVRSEYQAAHRHKYTR